MKVRSVFWQFFDLEKARKRLKTSTSTPFSTKIFFDSVCSHFVRKFCSKVFHVRFFALSIAIFVSFYRTISTFVLSRDVSKIHSSVCGCERFLKEVPAKMKTSRFST